MKLFRLTRYLIKSETTRFIVALTLPLMILFGCGREFPHSTSNTPGHANFTSSASALSDDYLWDYLAIGGGGYVTGIVIHPNQSDRKYIRTDVGGAYRWDAQNDRWVQMLSWVGPNDANLIGVDGIALDPNDTDRVYLALGKSENQPGGVYRSEDQGETWTLLHSANFSGNGREARWIGECIAVDPNNSDIIYAGTRLDGLWRSTNDGNTWSKVTDVPDGHTGGDPTGVRTIVFDPANTINGNSSTIYVGVPGEGIYYSTDAGNSFSEMDGVSAQHTVTGLDAGNTQTPYPVENIIDENPSTRWASWDGLDWSWVQFDLGAAKNVNEVQLMMYKGGTRTYPLKIEAGNSPSSLSEVWSGNSSLESGFQSFTFNSVSARYVRVSMTGAHSNGAEVLSIYEAQVWNSGSAPGPENPGRMQVVDEELFVTHGSGVAIWTGSDWEDITPTAGTGQNFSALAVDNTISDNIVVAERYSAFFNSIYRSTDKGQSWDTINDSYNIHTSVPWWGNPFSSATAAMAFEPGGSDVLWFTDWFGIWRTQNVWASTTDWYTIENGHEETVVVELVAPPSGALVYSGMADVFGFRHQAVDQYPSDNLYPVNEGFSIAVTEDSPNNIAILGSTSWGGDNTRLATSANYGDTWTDRTLPSGTTLGRIAISADDADNIVYVAGGGDVYYSTTRGNSWNTASGAPTNAIRLTNIWNKDFALAADKVNGDRFYLFDRQGSLYATNDGGANWSVQNSTSIPNQSGFLNVKTAPGIEGEVWVSLDNNGLWKSSNDGSTFSQISDFNVASMVSFGAPEPGTTTPAAYVYGRIGSQWGLYRSLDLGDNWEQINDENFQFPAGAKVLAADRNIFGRVYVGSGGVGIAYGELE